MNTSSTRGASTRGASTRAAGTRAEHVAGSNRTWDLGGDIVILAAANPWDGIPMADQQLARALAAHAPVLYVDPAQSVVSRYRKTGRVTATKRPIPSHVGDNLFRLTPEALPGLTRPGIAPLNRALIARQIRAAVGGHVAAVIEANILTPIMGRCGERLSVYWAQDDFAGMAPLIGKSSAAYAEADEEMSRRADRIIAANPLVAEGLRSRGRSVDLIPFGCDYETFSAPADPAPEVTLPEPIAVFMGHIGDRIDLDMLAAVAEAGTSVLLVGPRHPRTDLDRFQAILDRPNVQWVGGKPFDELPGYLATAGVGLLPYTLSDFNMGSFPLKTLEYLAAGLPVVASELPAMGWLDTDHIHLASTPAEFAAETTRILIAGRDPAGDAERQAFAAEHTWDRRAAAFAEVLGLAGTKQ